MLKLNEVSRWSNISQFASTPLAKTTIAAPFIAFLVLFNEGIRNYFSLEQPESASGMWGHILDSRLEIFYIGLVALGASIALFSVFAPQSATRQKNYSDFIAFKLETKTPNAVSASLVQSLRYVVEHTDFPNASIYDVVCEAIPRKTIDAIHRLLEAEFDKEIFQDGEITGQRPDLSRFYTAIGSLDIDAVLDVVVSQRRAEWVLWKPILDGSRLTDIDVFRLEYHVNDYSKPTIRKIVLVTFGISIFVVLIPTILTVVTAFGRVLGLG